MENTIQNKPKHVRWKTPPEYKGPKCKNWDTCNYQCAQARYCHKRMKSSLSSFVRNNPPTNNYTSNKKSKAENPEIYSYSLTNIGRTKSSTRRMDPNIKRTQRTSAPKPNKDQNQPQNNPGICRSSVTNIDLKPVSEKVKSSEKVEASSFSIRLTPYFLSLIHI